MRKTANERTEMTRPSRFTLRPGRVLRFGTAANRRESLIASSSTKKLRVGIFDPVHTLDPRRAQDYVSLLVLGQIMEPPYMLPGNCDQPEPWVFSEPLRCEQTGSQPVYSAAIREDICFSNGTKLTAAHVAKWLSGVGRLQQNVKVKTDGDRVLFFLNEANARFDLVLTHCNCGIALGAGSSAIGAGPYQIAERTADGGVRLVKNPHYHKEVAIDEIEFSVYPRDQEGRPTALLSALSKGEADIATVLSRRDVTKLRGVKKWFDPGHSTAVLYMNVERSELAEVEFRKAIASALDRRKITETSYDRALAYTATSILPPVLGQARDGLFCDSDKAKHWVAEHRPSAMPRLSLLTTWAPRPYLPDPRAAAQEIVEELATIGLEVEIQQPDSAAEYYLLLEQGNYDLVLAGWIADTPDPAEFLEALLASGSIPEPDRSLANAANLSRWRSPEMPRLLAEYRHTGTVEARDAILSLVREQVPLIPLMYGPSIVTHGLRVKNYKNSPLGLWRFATLDLG